MENFSSCIAVFINDENRLEVPAEDAYMIFQQTSHKIY
jgi:hypothetical protein